MAQGEAGGCQLVPRPCGLRVICRVQQEPRSAGGLEDVEAQP